MATYHRIRSKTQTLAHAILQQRSGELWGQPARGSQIPKVKAYVGPLPDDRYGIEFLADVPPDPGCPPGHAYWSGPRDGVRVEDDYAKIRIRVTQRRYPEE